MVQTPPVCTLKMSNALRFCRTISAKQLGFPAEPQFPLPMTAMAPDVDLTEAGGKELL